MKSSARTVKSYLEGLPDDRRATIATLRNLVLRHLPAGYEEVVDYGMLVYQVPLAVYPDTYNKRPFMYAALASQKNHLALYLCHVQAMAPLRRKVEAGFKAAGKKLDMGKACLRFQALDDLPLPVISEAVAAIPMATFVEHGRAIHPKKAKPARG